MSDSRTDAGVRLSQLQELEIGIDQLVAGGDGLGRFEGIPIFVPRAAPGDRLRVRLVERRPGYGRGEIVEILEPGPDRRDPPCPHFERCGGCDLQHLEDRAQLRLKAEATLETLRRLGKVAVPGDFEVVTGDAWGYRLRTQVRVRQTPEGEPQVGYFERGSHALVPISACPILVPELEAAVLGLARSLPAEAPQRVDLTAGDGGAWTAAPAVEGLPHDDVSIAVSGSVLELDARCFFQGHRGLLERLVEVVVGEERGDTACDLYAGVGLFSLPLARRYASVTAVEGDRVATRYARRNARRNRLGVDVVHQAVETWVAAMPEGLDRVVVDPPRAGLDRRVTEALLEKAPRRVTYVSCHAAALARDLGRLADGYRFDELTLVDLFPQTGHMEVVAQLHRI